MFRCLCRKTLDPPASGTGTGGKNSCSGFYSKHQEENLHATKQKNVHRNKSFQEAELVRESVVGQEKFTKTFWSFFSHQITYPGGGV